MALDVIDKKIKQKEIKNVKSQNAVECKLEMSEEDVLNVCFSSANAVLLSYECSENEVKYQGKVVFNVVVGGEELKKYEAGVEFSYKVEVMGANQDSEILAHLKVENVKVSLQNGIPTAYATVTFIGEVIKYIDIDYVSLVNDINVKTEDCEYSILAQKAQKDFSLEDEFTLNYLINNVYSHFENVKILETTTGIGILVVSGEVEVSMVVEKADDKALIYEKRVIPFRFEHDIDRALPNSVAISDLSFLDTNIKVLVDEAKGVSTMSILSTLKLTSFVYENQKFRYLVDCYKCDKYIDVSKQNNVITREVGEIIVNERVKASKNVNLLQNTLLGCPLFAKIEKIEVESRDGEVYLTGATTVSFLVKSQSQYLTQAELVPFEIKLNAVSENVSILDSHALNLTLIEDNAGILVEFDLAVTLSKSKTINVSLIKSLQEGEDKKVNTSAISVYVASRGDTLWDISKRLGVCEDDVLRTNKDLVFPLSGDERIVIYRELKK